MPFSGCTVIFGCGNTLLGDDGYGPAVIAQLEAEQKLPDEVTTVDAGTGIREYLFDYLLAPKLRPKQILILDAVDFPDRTAGEVFAIHPTEIPVQKIHDFSLHQFPTINLLCELEEETGMQISILAAQVQSIPTRVAPGLSKPMKKAVAKTCEQISSWISLQQNFETSSGLQNPVSPGSQAPAWEPFFRKLQLPVLCREAGASNSNVPKQELGNEKKPYVLATKR